MDKLERLLGAALVASWFIALPPAPCQLGAPLNQWLIISALQFPSADQCRASILDELKFLRTINPPQSLDPQCTRCLSTDQIIKGVK